MKTKRILAAGLIGLALLAGCSKNPVSNDQNNNNGGVTPGNAGEPYTRDALKPEGNVTTTDKGFDVEGTLTVESDQGAVPFLNADLQVEFDLDGKLVSVKGRADIPPPSKNIEFTTPVQADVGYYPGTYINANPDFTIQVKEDRYYFVFYFALALEMKIATNGDANATKPIGIKAPIGGKAVMVVDFDDPLLYTYGEQDLIGGAGTGTSQQGLIPFAPIQPLDAFSNFDGKSIRTGNFPVYGFLNVKGAVIRSKEYSVDLMSDDIFGSAKAGEKAGINGEFDFNVGIKNVLSFTVPLGSASGGASFEATTGGVTGVVSINGLANPDNSWWPDLLAFKPSTQMRAKGFLTSKGAFDLTLSGDYGLAMPDRTYSVTGKANANNDAMSFTGRVAENGTSIDLAATVANDSTRVGVILPDEINFSPDDIVASVDSTLNEVEQALADLERATADYQFELSLRGLRQALPGIVDRATSEMDKGIATAKQKVRDAADWCSGHPDLSGIDKLAAPYYSALRRLKNAALNTTDNNATRNEIAAALRDLAARKILKGSVAISGKVKKIICVSYSTTRSVNVRIMSDSQVQQLLDAANAVKYIAETSTIMIEARQIYDRLPTKEVLERVRTEVANGVALVPTVDEVGFVHVHGGSTYHYYVVLSGVRHEMGSFELTVAGVAGAVSELIIEMLSPK